MGQQALHFIRFVEDQHWNVRMVPVNRAGDIRETLERLRNNGLIDSTLYKKYFSYSSFTIPDELPGARSIIITAVPTPQMRVLFTLNGKPIPVTIPPTYVAYTNRTHKVQREMSHWLTQHGFRLAKSRLPLKTLAVHSGLASYGRNNICYVPGMGSYIQLVGAFTDLECDNDPWQEPRILERCRTCEACLRHCPTGAISPERFLLLAEKCLTYHNESPENIPGWINPSSHHSWIGCMKCQTVCPENKEVWNWFEDCELFTEKETIMLIKGKPLGDLPQETATKIRDLEINEDYQVLCRNLSLILKEKK
jgi:epoxyqueuosine reductase